MRHSVPRTCPRYAENLFTDPLLSSGWLVADRVATRLGIAGERAGSATILKGGCIGRVFPQRNSPWCIGFIGNSLLTDPALSSPRLVAAWIATPLARAAYHAGASREQSVGWALEAMPPAAVQHVRVHRYAPLLGMHGVVEPSRWPSSSLSVRMS